MRGLLFVVALVCSVPVAAGPHFGAADSSATPSLQRVAERQLSVEQAAQIAQRAVGGRVLAAEPGSVGGRPVVRVKLLTRNGVVRVVVVDAVTGQLR